MEQSVSLKTRLAGYNWITGAPFTLSVILMEVFWVYPWLIWVSQIPEIHWYKTPLSLFSLILILGISFAGSKYFLNREISLRRVRFSIVGIGLITIFTVIRFEYGPNHEILNGDWFVYISNRLLNSFSHFEPLILAIIIAVLLWLRGIKLGRSNLDANDIFRNFLIAIAFLVLLILVSGATSWTNFVFDMSSVWPHLAGFFFFGLLAMALANLKSIQQKVSAEAVSPAMNRRWFSILLVIIGGVVTIGIAIVSTISSDFSYFLTQSLNTLSNLMGQILYYIYLPFSYVVEWLYQLGMRIIHMIGSENPDTIEVNDVNDLTEGAEKTFQGLPPEVILVLKWVFFGIIAAVIIYLLVKAIFRYTSSKGKENIDETDESLLSWDMLKSDFRLMLEKLRGLASIRRQPTRAAVLPDWYSDEYQGMLSVRQIYEVLQWEAARQNMGRYRYETPIEYADRFYRRVPESREPLGEITDLYLEARYGEHEFPAGILEYANFKWKSLRRLLRGPENG